MPTECKKLKNGPPPYLDLLENIFDGVAVDGSIAYYPGQPNNDEDDEEEEEEDYTYF